MNKYLTVAALVVAAAIISGGYYYGTLQRDEALQPARQGVFPDMSAEYQAERAREAEETKQYHNITTVPRPSDGIYRDEQGGFEFQYPIDWEVKIDEITGYRGGAKLTYLNSKDGFCRAETSEAPFGIEPESPPQGTTINIRIDDREVPKFSTADTVALTLYPNRRNLFLVFSGDPTKACFDEFNQMISTLKFL